MSGACCTGGRPAGRRTRFSGAVSSMLPGALLLLLPKCPLCLAAWLAAATGIGISAAAVAPARSVILCLWVAAAVLAVARILRRARVFQTPPSHPRPRVFPCHRA